MSDKYTSEQLAASIKYKMPLRHWMDIPADFRKGTYNHAGNPDSLNYIGQPNARKWQP